MATSPTPDSAIRPRREEQRDSTPRDSRTVKAVENVDPTTLARIRQDELDERWRLAGREE
mgnify:CR=1 FL=1